MNIILDKLIGNTKTYKVGLEDVSELAQKMHEELKKFEDYCGIKESNSEIIQIIQKYKDKHDVIINKIRMYEEKVQNELVKINVFGSVSVGKSTLLNALLYYQLFETLPSETTSCFVKINISISGCHELRYLNFHKKFESLDILQSEIENLSTEGYDNDDVKLNENNSLNVHLNIKDKQLEKYYKIKNKILDERTQIVDMPGSSNNDIVTNCIQNESLDTDIFIFIITNTFTEQEKLFFENHIIHGIKSSVIILVNKWDNIKNPNKEIKSRNKIISNMKFFTNILQKINLAGRIYFISAGEMETLRTTDQKIESQTCNSRCHEFIEFEDSLLSCINETREKRKQIIETEFNENNIVLISYLNDFIKEMKGEYWVKRKKEKIKLENYQNNLKKFADNKKIIVKARFENTMKEIDGKYSIFDNKLTDDNIETIQLEITEWENKLNEKLSKLNELLIEQFRDMYKEFNKLVDLNRSKIDQGLKEDQLLAKEKLMLQNISKDFGRGFNIIISVGGGLVCLVFGVAALIPISLACVIEEGRELVKETSVKVVTTLIPAIKEKLENDNIRLENKKKINESKQLFLDSISERRDEFDKSFENKFVELNNKLQANIDYIIQYDLEMDKCMANIKLIN